MRIGVLFFLSLLLVSGLVVGQDVNDSDLNKIKDSIDKIPIDPNTGAIDLNRSFNKTKAEGRIAAINEYVGPITEVVFGVQLTLSWIFVFSFVVWILLIEMIVMPVSDIFGYNIWGSLFASALVASLAMQGFGEDLALWMGSLATAWWAGAVTLGVAVVFGVVYSVVMKVLGKKMKVTKKAGEEEQTRQDREIIHVDAEASRKELER